MNVCGRLHSIYCRLLLCLCAVCLFLPAWAGSSGERGDLLASVPFELGSDNRVYVSCRANGSGPLRFLVDTGATSMVVNSESPRVDFPMTFDGKGTNLGATGSNEVPTSSRNVFSLGGLTFRDVPFISLPFASEKWDGVIGLWWLRRHVTVLDYDNKVMRLYRNGSYSPPAGAIRLKVDYVLGVPVVPLEVTVNGNTYRLRVEVDTGSDRVIDLNTPFVRKHRLSGTLKPFSVSTISGSDSNSGRLENVWFDSVGIGSYRLPRIPGAFSSLTSGVQSSSDMDGVMGNNFLKRFNLACDFEAGFIYLIPNDLFYTPFFQEPKAGL